ncbi:MAG: hypothetical protein KBS36_05060 [Bacteroidales bacterium]|nr:hypothetical protein [Candidatus Cryptobacteroides fimicaballi]
MNIIVKTYGGSIVFRPETTWKRGDDCVFLPEFIDSVEASPVVFVRICKSGRSVAARFATRYYDAVGYGMLLYPTELLNKGPEGFASACCLDHTSFLSLPSLDRMSLGAGELCIAKGDETAYYKAPDAATIESALELATRFCYIRTGDYLAIELEEKRPLCNRQQPPLLVQGSYEGSPLFDFTVNF